MPRALLRSSPMAFLMALVAAAGLPAQDAAPDSARMREAAEEAQKRLESFREERIPPMDERMGGSCDDLIGRMCLRYGDENGERRPLPEEPIQVDMARRDLIEILDAAGQALPGDRWILGQRVFYLTESGATPRALALTEACPLPSTQAWWCDALRGYVLHATRRTAEADAAFADAMAAMPAEERERWRAPRWLLDPDAQEIWEDASPDERDALREQLWLLSDPLYLVPLNDRRTEHWARRVYILLREEAANPWGLEWEEDLEQLAVRYGGTIGWERSRGTPQVGNLTQDTRRLVGRHHPDGRDYVPPGPVFADPGATEVGSWTLEVARPRTGYAPAYAPVIEELDAQVARFRRGDSLHLVAAFAPPGAESSAPAVESGSDVVDDPFAREERPEIEPDASWGVRTPTGEVETGVFLVRPDGSDTLVVEGDEASDIVEMRAPNGPWVVSAEVFEPTARHAWRARGGASQQELPLGLVAVSDVLVLNVGDSPPDDFDEAVSRARASLDLAVDAPFGLAWEVYGLELGEGAQVSIGLRQGSPGFLQRVGQLFRIVDPEQPILLTFEDSGPSGRGPHFRAVDLSLPELEPGEYTLILEITIPGREPVVANRTIRIVP